MNSLGFFSEFCEQKLKIVRCELMPYKWYTLPENPPLAYSMMLGEHASELANIINKLSGLISDLEAWSAVIENKTDQDKYNISVNFLDTLATVSINLPYVIRSRFIYSSAHLSHQANQFTQKDWKDDFPIDEKVYFCVCDKYSAPWKSYKKLKLAIEKISSKKYQEDTLNFRNKYNHRYSPRIEVGITGFVTRIVNKDKSVSYGIGGTEPLKVGELAKLLEKEHKNCAKSFLNYQNLVAEQIGVISCA